MAEVSFPMRVPAGSSIILQPGARLMVAPGASVVPDAGGQAPAISDVATDGTASPADVATAINKTLAALRAIGVIAAS